MDIKMGKAERTKGKQTKRPSLPIWMLIKSKLSVRVVVLLRLPVTSSLFTCRVNLVLLATACNHPNNYSFWLCFHYWRYEGLQLVTTWPPLSPKTVEARLRALVINWNIKTDRMENVIVFVSKLTFKERNSSKSIQKWVSILQTKASMCSIENCTEHKMTRGPSSPNKLLPIKRRAEERTAKPSKNRHKRNKTQQHRCSLAKAL